MIAFIDEQREYYGVEPICKQLPIAVSIYYEHKAREANPDREPDRVNRQFVASRPLRAGLVLDALEQAI